MSTATPSICHEWRPMSERDLPAILSIAALAHPTLPERGEVLSEKLRLYPAGCKVLARPDSAEAPIEGYFFSHPWYPDAIPALDTLLEAIPPLTNTYYLHDLALLPLARGNNHGAHVVRQIDHHARLRGYSRQALVSVNKTELFWRRLGFEWVNCPAAMDTLAKYGPDARMMVRLTST